MSRRPPCRVCGVQAGSHLRGCTAWCWHDRKLRFPDRAAALVALTEAKIARNLHRKLSYRQQRTYECRSCAGWHLTSKPDRFARKEAS